jgi:hypothetical protein
VTEDGRLIRVRMEYEAEKYDFECEQRTPGHNQPMPAVHEASVRRLADVVSLNVAKVSTRFDGFNKPMRDQVNVGEVRLTFSNGNTVDLGLDQTGVHAETNWHAQMHC